MEHLGTDQNVLLAHAIQIASDAHVDDLDKGGKPYILHPLRIMMRLRTDDPELMQIAVLHDVIEDHGDVYTLDYLESLGFSERVIFALALLTHDKKAYTYKQYILMLSANKDCILVKLEDLRDNSDITRLKGVTEKDLKRTERYHKAYVFLEHTLKTKF